MLLSEQSAINSTHSADLESLPVAVLRIAGVPFRGLRKIRAENTAAAMSSYLEAEDRVADRTQHIVTQLETHIGSLQSSPLRKDLISIKRAIYNDRLPSSTLLANITMELKEPKDGSTPLDHVHEWISARDQLNRMRTGLDPVFSEELTSNRSSLAALLRLPSFARALAIASPSLSREATQYTTGRTSDSSLRVSRAERSFVNYLSRSSLKLSPFSSFTISSLVIPRNAPGPLPRIQQRLHRHVAVNQALIATLAFHIAQDHDFSDRALIYLNPSITFVQDAVRLVRHKYDFTSPNRSRVPREALLRLPELPAIRRIMELLQGRLTPIGEIRDEVERLAGILIVDNSSLESLAQIGLVGRSLLAQESPLCEDILSFLEDSKSARAEPLHRSINELTLITRSFPKANANRRGVLLSEFETGVHKTYEQLDVPLAKSWAGLSLYEDVTTVTQNHLHSWEDWRSALRDLRTMLGTFVPLLDGSASARETLRYILRTQYQGRQTQLLPLMEHYSKVIQIVRPSTNPVLRDYTPNSLGLDSLSELAELRREFGVVMSEAHDSEELDLREIAEKMAWARRVVALHLTRTVSNTNFMTCYCQPSGPSLQSERLILNKLHAGPLRAAMRVVSATQVGPHRNAILEELRRQICLAYEDAEPCEIRAPFDFNVNLQDPITSRFIDYTGKSSGDERAISLSELLLTDTPNGLMLSSSREPQKPLVPLTFGLMATVYQPPLQYVLLSLGTKDPVIYRPFDPSSWNLHKEHTAPIVRFPRLVFGGVILRRRGWAVRHTELPQRTPNDSASSTFLRVLRWKREMKLPDEVFVRARTFEECIQGPNEQTQKKRVLHKPQYVDFANYFLVESFLALCLECKSYMYLEEAAPSSREWERFGIHRASETVIDLRPHAAGESRLEELSPTWNTESQIKQRKGDNNET